jgi:replicative DNA helicase
MAQKYDKQTCFLSYFSLVEISSNAAESSNLRKLCGFVKLQYLQRHLCNIAQLNVNLGVSTMSAELNRFGIPKKAPDLNYSHTLHIIYIYILIKNFYFDN